MIMKITTAEGFDVCEVVNFERTGNYLYVMIKGTEGYDDFEYENGECFQTKKKFQKLEIFTDQMALITSL